MRALFLLFLFITSVRLDGDICEFLKPRDDFYVPGRDWSYDFHISLYHRFRPWRDIDKKDWDRYFLFRRDERSSTRMWEFTIESDLRHEITVRLMGESVESIRDNATHAFSLEASDNLFVWNCSAVIAWDPDYVHGVPGRDPEIYCHREIEKGVLSRRIAHGFGIEKELVFRPKPSDRTVILIFRKSSISYFTLEIRGGKIVVSEPSLWCEAKTPRVCPLFLETIQQQSPQHFSKLVDIVDFTVGNSSGHLLLFNINGEPKYCIHLVAATNVSKCTSDTDLRPLADHCYRSNETGGLSGWDIAAILLAIIFCIVAISCLVYFFWWTYQDSLAANRIASDELSPIPDHQNNQSITEPTAGSSAETPVRRHSAPVVSGGRPAALQRQASDPLL